MKSLTKGYQPKLPGLIMKGDQDIIVLKSKKKMLLYFGKSLDTRFGTSTSHHHLKNPFEVKDKHIGYGTVKFWKT